MDENNKIILEIKCGDFKANNKLVKTKNVKFIICSMLPYIGIYKNNYYLPIYFLSLLRLDEIGNLKFKSIKNEAVIKTLETGRLSINKGFY